MAYVILDNCEKDEECIAVCPVDCIHPRKDEAGFEEAAQLYVHPTDCIDCGACVPVCPTNSIIPVNDLPEDQQRFIEVNSAYFEAKASS